jgi:hypothetical protein
VADWKKRSELRRTAREALGHTEEERLLHMQFEPVVDGLWELTQDPGLFEWYDTPMYAYSCVECAADFAMGYARLFAQWLETEIEVGDPGGPFHRAKWGDHFKVKRVLDYGAGIGASTRLMGEMLPGRQVMFSCYTSQSAQWRVWKELMKDAPVPNYSYGYEGKHVEDAPNAVCFFDVLEHEKRPFDVVKKFMDSRACRVICMANSFTQEGDLGHWKEYKFDASGLKASRKGAAAALRGRMRNAGWRSVDTGFWNSRPEIWVRA